MVKEKAYLLNITVSQEYQPSTLCYILNNTIILSFPFHRQSCWDFEQSHSFLNPGWGKHWRQRDQPSPVEAKVKERGRVEELTEKQDWGPMSAQRRSSRTARKLRWGFLTRAKMWGPKFPSSLLPRERDLVGDWRHVTGKATKGQSVSSSELTRSH